MNTRTTRSQGAASLYQSACEFQRGFSRAANRFLCAALLLAALAGGFAPRAEAVVSATGGNQTNEIDGYRIHIYTNVGTWTFNVSTGGLVEVLVVAGGGSGGGSYYHGGGGGAGGLIYNGTYSVVPGSYEVRVGKGGDALAAGSGAQGNNGSNSWFGGLVAYGGGGGGNYSSGPGKVGGSGGGGAGLTYTAAGNPTNGQGFAGGTGGGESGRGSGGGGGAGTNGVNGTSTGIGGNGGAGLYIAAFTNWGDPAYPGWFAGGGGGSYWTAGTAGSGGKGGGGNGGDSSDNAGKSGKPNTGGGGGGPISHVNVVSGAGGSGIVLVRYSVVPAALDVASLGATALKATGATLQGQLLEDGGDGNTTLAFCWGTSDGGTGSTSLWANVIPMGPGWAAGGIFSNVLGGLQSGTTYVYRCYATNTTGFDWSGTSTFTTVYLPSVTNRGAGPVYNTMATLRGEVLDTGVETPATWFDYWMSSGGPTSSVSMGPRSGSFSVPVLGLSPDTTYSFHVRASNDAGTVRSTVSAFTTSPWRVIDNEEAGFSQYDLTLYSTHSALGAYNGNDRFSLTPTATNRWAAWTFSGLPNGQYDVAVCHPSGWGGVNYNRYTVDGGLAGCGWLSSVGCSYWTNELQLAETTGVVRAFSIITATPVKVSGGTLTVRLNAYTSTWAMAADAVAVSRATTNRTVWICDDASGVLEHNFPTVEPSANAVGGFHMYSSAGSGASNEYARWRFAAVPPGWYRIWVCWPSAGNNTTNAVYSVFAGDATNVLGVQSVNQRVAPLQHVQDRGVWWQQLTNGAAANGTYRIMDNVFGVRLQAVDNTSNNDYTRADAVRAELVQPISQQGTIYLMW